MRSRLHSQKIISGGMRAQRRHFRFLGGSSRKNTEPDILGKGGKGSGGNFGAQIHKSAHRYEWENFGESQSALCSPLAMCLNVQDVKNGKLKLPSEKVSLR